MPTAHPRAPVAPPPRGGASTARRRPRPAGRPAAADAPTDVRADVCEVACVDQVQVERARRALPADATLRTLAETFRALGDPTRLRIVAALAAPGVGELCVCDLATLVDVSESAVSHSLRTLRQLRVVQYRKAGKIAYYRLDGAQATRLVADGIEHVDAGAAARG